VGKKWQKRIEVNGESIMTKNINYIDLFAGAGGLSEGFIQAGFKPLAHVEMSPSACRTLETRAAFHYLKTNGKKLSKYYDYERGIITRDELLAEVPQELLNTVICAEMSDKTIKSVFERIDILKKNNHVEHVDVIIGGPPCQAYSLVGRAQSSHMNVPMEEDPRNELYKMYTRFLKHYNPDMFIFENVTGIKSARNGETFKNLQAQLKRVGYEIECNEQNAQNFGVLQARKRMIIVGWKKGSNHFYPKFQKIVSEAFVKDVLFDLPKLQRGETNNHYRIPSAKAKAYVIENGIRDENDVLTFHTARKNTPRDAEIYRRAIEAWNDGKRLKYYDLPKELVTHNNVTSFIDRFKVVEGNRHACHTILAHLSKDGHYFIHPDIKQCRSITVREAARLQSFPDNYYFEGDRTSQFVQIGNAVPPKMAYVIAKSIKEQLGK